MSVYHKNSKNEIVSFTNLTMHVVFYLEVYNLMYITYFLYNNGAVDIYALESNYF